jgi:hypothetical protein
MTGQHDSLLVPPLADRGAEAGSPPGDLGVQIAELCPGEPAGLLPGVDPEPLMPGQRRDIGRQRDLPPVAVVLMFPGARPAQEPVCAPPQAGQVVRRELMITHERSSPRRP